MSIVEHNKVVSITYEIWDKEGNMHERVDVPIQYVHGANSQIFEQIEAALDGKSVDQRVEVTLSPEEGFGDPDPEMMFTDDIDNVPLEFRQVGAEVEMQNERGETKNFVVSKIEDGKLTVDGNHPLAGKVITFKIVIVEIRDATDSEIRSGEPEGGPQLH